jgi:hypothetical protein
MKFLSNKELRAELAKLPDDLLVGDEYAEGFITGVYTTEFEDDNGSHNMIGLQMSDADPFYSEEEEEEEDGEDGTGV